MVVLSYGTIRHYATAQPDATDALNNWYYIYKQADWANFNELRNMYGSVDAVR